MYASTVTALKAQLEKQLGLMLELRDTSSRKQHALVKCRLDALQPLSEQEQVIAGQLNACESRRVDLLRQFQEEGRIDSTVSVDTMTLLDLLELLPAEDLPELRKLAQTLHSEAEALRELNLQNDSLTANLMDYTASVMRLLTQDNGVGHYTASGMLSGLPGRAMLDSRV